MSGFMPRHIEQPALRQSKPASVKTASRPSCSACSFTSIEPGTTIARTPSATRRPADDVGGGAQVLHAAVRARAEEDGVDGDLAQRRPGGEAHVGERALGGVALAAGRQRLRVGDDVAERRRPAPGLVPQVTNGVTAEASRTTSLSNTASSSVRRVSQWATAASQSAPCGACGRPCR